MSVAHARVVRVRRVVQFAGGGVSLDERTIRHARVVEHEAPLQTDEIESGGGVLGQEVGLQFEAGDEGRDGIGGFDGGGTVRTPTGGERGGDGGDLGIGGRQVADYRPAVPVLGVEGGGFVVAVESRGLVPETIVRRDFDCLGGGAPVGKKGLGFVEGAAELDALVDCVVEDGVGFDVVAAHAEAEPVVGGSYVHEVAGVDVGQGPREGEFPVLPFRLEVREIVGVEIVVSDTDEGVEMVGEGCGWWEGNSCVRQQARCLVLDCEEGVEGVGDGDQVVG